MLFDIVKKEENLMIFLFLQKINTAVAHQMVD